MTDDPAKLKTVFDEIQQEVLNTMSKDSFREFLNSEKYKKLSNQHNNAYLFVYYILFAFSFYLCFIYL